MLQGYKLLAAAVVVPTLYVEHQFKFQHGFAMLPHPRKLKRGGEDALFAMKNKLGVFDGVSAWMEDGIDAGIFAFSLSDFTQHASIDCSPKEAIQNALDQTTAIGSATACVVHLNSENGLLSACNLGDSGFWLLRRKPRTMSSWYSFLWFLRKQIDYDDPFIIVQKSTPMMHSTEDNIPYQLSSKDSQVQDELNEAQIFEEIQTQVGDIVLLATDGLFDNLSDEEILECVNDFEMTHIASSKHLAWQLASKAYKKYDVIDDISVVVGQVVLHHHP